MVSAGVGIYLKHSGTADTVANTVTASHLTFTSEAKHKYSLVMILMCQHWHVPPHGIRPSHLTPPVNLYTGSCWVPKGIRRVLRVRTGLPRLALGGPDTVVGKGRANPTLRLPSTLEPHSNFAQNVKRKI